MSLIVHLLGIVFVALTLVAAGNVIDAIRQRSAAEENLRVEAANTTQIAALDMGRVLEGARQLMIGMANTDIVQEHDPERCSALARAVVDGLPAYDFLSVTDRNDRAICSSNRTLLNGQVLPNQMAGETAIATDQFVVGLYSRSLIRNNAVIRLAYPVKTKDGAIIAAINVGLRIDWLNDSIAGWRLPENAVIDIADRNGTIIASHPRGETIVGRRLTAGLFAVLGASAAGNLVTIGVNGRTERLYGYVPVTLQPAAGLFVAIGLDRKIAIAAIDHAMWMSLARLAGLFLVLSVLAWLYAQRFIQRPIQHLLAAALRWQSDDWSARAKTDTSVAEFNRLAGAFDSMAETAALRETALRRSQEHLSRAQRVAVTGSFEHNFRIDQLVWSDEMYRIYGISPDRGPLSPAEIEAMLLPEDRKEFHEAFALAQSDRPIPRFESRFRRSDGSIRQIAREVEALRDENGNRIGNIGVIRDVTEQREAERRRDELERQLLHGQKLEAIGTLAGGIAHDLNNTLMPIVGLTPVLLEKAPEGSSEREILMLIAEAGTRARALVRNILTFARRSDPERRKVDLGSLTATALKLARATLPTTITIRERIDPVPPIWADEGEIHQVLLNLATNAADAIGDKVGTITIEVTTVPGSRAEPGASRVRFSMTDTGCGMDAATCERIFEPFYTTKPVDIGTGLGLSIVHGIVTSHGGSITVESERSDGTRFDLYFPVCDGLALESENI